MDLKHVLLRWISDFSYLLCFYYMPLKDLERRKEYQAHYNKTVWYPSNKERHLKNIKRNKQATKKFIEEYKRQQKCVDCGFSGKDFPYVLDFDHIEGLKTKKFTIGSWSHSVISLHTIKKEMNKCELVCANCHRIRTFKEKRKR